MEVFKRKKVGRGKRVEISDNWSNWLHIFVEVFKVGLRFMPQIYKGHLANTFFSLTLMLILSK